MTTLSVENVTAGYGELDILRGVSIEVGPDEIVTVIGPNGAGKSTLMKAIFGLVRPKDGRIVFLGEDVTGERPNWLVERGLCYVPQNENVFPSLSVEENLQMGGFALGGDLRRELDRVYGIFPPLREKRHVRAGVLSGGQQQMVAIGRALMLKPKLLLLDEPTAGLSPVFARMILEKVQEINGTGVPVLMIEQNARAALAMSHRGYVLTTGQNRRDGRASDLLADREVGELFLGGLTSIEYVQLLVYGIVLGSIIAIGAVGLTLTFGILNFANFAHGDTMTLGAYFTLFFKVGLGWPLWISLLAAMAGTAFLSVLIDKALYRRLRVQGAIALLTASIGIALIMRNLISLLWGPGNQYYNQGIQFPWRVYGILIKPDHVLILGLAAALVLLIHIFLKYTKLGKAMRATSDNATLALVSGIDTDRVVLWTWIIGGALACAAGVMIGIDTELLPRMGWNMLLPIFAAVILGGIGSPYGAMAGGMIIGVTQELSTAFVSTAYKPVVAFIIMILILLIRPSGIFNVKGAVKL